MHDVCADLRVNEQFKAFFDDDCDEIDYGPDEDEGGYAVPCVDEEEAHYACEYLPA